MVMFTLNFFEGERGVKDIWKGCLRVFGMREFVSSDIERDDMQINFGNKRMSIHEMQVFLSTLTSFIVFK